MHNEEELTHIDHALHEAIQAHTKAWFSKGKTINAFDSEGTYIGTYLSCDSEPVYDIDRAVYFTVKVEALNEEKDLLELLSIEEEL
tara:strand:- start:5164 stop:5421 length:258 start_codon:yes stop_codon:yes gene_type:complete